jgi:bacterial/archaeal transporter family-2 protein
MESKLALAWFGAVTLGVLLTLQVGVNGLLQKSLGHPLTAGLASFAIGGTALLLLCLMIGTPLPFLTSPIASVPWYAWTGGLMGAVYVTGSIELKQRLGAAVLVGLVVAGQFIASVVIDHYGWLGFPKQPLTTERVIGVALLLAGAIIICRR